MKPPREQATRAMVEALRRSSREAAARAGLTEADVARLINRELPLVPPPPKKGRRYRAAWAGDVLCVIPPLI